MKRLGFVLCVTLVGALGAGVAAARADAGAADVAPAGVAIGHVQIGGMTPEEAAAAVQKAFLRPVVLRLDGRKITVSPSRFHTVAPLAVALRRAFAAQPGTDVRLRASADAAKVAAWVRALAKRYDTTAVASRFLLRRARPVLTKSVAGRAIEVDHTRDAILARLREGVRTPVTVPVRVTTPRAPKTPDLLIVIRRGANRLTLYNGTRFVRSFAVATGQPSYPTPLGSFRIVVMAKNPTWYPPTQDDWAKGLKPVPPGPGNPLGTRWMGISAPGIGIHGTDDPASIGYSASHGCIRMHVPDAEWLFAHVAIGVPVYVVAQ